jgi:pimeloyl-ACP methyl ester carboxylesterase
MISAATFLCGLLLAAEPIETRFAQQAPAGLECPERSEGQQRAVVLIHGLRVQPFSSRKVRQADFQLWQEPGSRLVEALGPHADVYAFAYSQNVPLEAIAAEPALGEHVRELKEAGYEEIVLIGHSAGGLIARHLVEDRPDAGVTKVIQVCTPNGGSALGKFSLGVCACQEPFLDSLTKEGRREALAGRPDKQIPPHVEFVCLVGQLQMDLEADLGPLLGEGRDVRLACAGTLCGDGILSVASQWPEDLRRQRIPAQPLRAAHFTAMFMPATARQLAELLLEPQPRFSAEEVAAAERSMQHLEWTGRANLSR